MQTFFVATALLLLGAVRAFDDFDQGNPMTWLYLGGLIGTDVALVLLYGRMERPVMPRDRADLPWQSRVSDSAPTTPACSAPGCWRASASPSAGRRRTCERRLESLGAAPGRDVLVHAAPVPAGADGTRRVLDEAWDAIRAIVLPPQRGLIVLIAPPPGDAHAEAARSGLENLARTLSIEWSRHAIRPVAILPGPRSTDDEVAELVAFLASKAGAYYAGCAFTLR